MSRWLRVVRRQGANKSGIPQGDDRGAKAGGERIDIPRNELSSRDTGGNELPHRRLKSLKMVSEGWPGAFSGENSEAEHLDVAVTCLQN